MKCLVKYILLVVLFAGANAYSHARFKPDNAAPPRSTNAGIKQGPCGSAAQAPRRVTVTEMDGGSEVTIRWEETIQHPGRYYIEFSQAGDTNWTRLKEVVDDQDGAIQNGVYHQYETTVTLPNVNCNDCAIRLIQSMEENPANPTFYYSCADITLTAQGAEEPPVGQTTPDVLGDGTEPSCSH